MGNIPPELSVGAFPNSLSPAQIVPSSSMDKSIQTEETSAPYSFTRRYPSPGHPLQPQLSGADVLEMVRPHAGMGDRESKLTHSDDTSKSRMQVSDWSLLESAEAQLTKRNFPAMIPSHASATSPTRSVVVSHIREKSDSALMASPRSHPQSTPRIDPRKSLEMKKDVVWNRPRVERKRKAVKRPNSDNPKALTIHLNKEMRASPQGLKKAAPPQATKSSQSPVNSGASSASHLQKPLRNSCSSLTLPKRVTVTLKDVGNTRKLRTFGAASPTLEGEAKTVKVDLESGFNLVSQYRKAQGDLPMTDSTSNNSLPPKPRKLGEIEDHQRWSHPRGPSPTLHDLELVEKETIRRQFGKVSTTPQSSLLRSLSKSPKGTLIRSPRTHNRYDPPPVKDDIRGFEMVPPTLNLSEIEKKEHESSSSDQPQKTSDFVQQDWQMPM